MTPLPSLILRDTLLLRGEPFYPLPSAGGLRGWREKKGRAGEGYNKDKKGFPFHYEKGEAVNEVD